MVSATDTDSDVVAGGAAEAASEPVLAMIWKGYFYLSLTIRPLEPLLGWRVGRGKNWSTHSTGQVDLLLTREAKDGVHGSHAYITFNRSSGMLVLEARHARDGVMIGSTTFTSKDPPQALNRPPILIQIGRLQYLFEYTVPSHLEDRFRAAKESYFKTELRGAPPPHPLTSATPSVSDVRVGDWTSHGISGIGGTSVVHAASHCSGSIAAFKALTRGHRRDAEAVEREIQLYEDIARVLEQHSNREYVMQLKQVFYERERGRNYVDGTMDQVHLLYMPLAQGTLDELVLNKGLRTPSRETKVIFLYQLLQGLDALHSTCWLDRDIKPPNIGIVSIDPPKAVIIDLGQARFLGSQSGFPPRPGTCGTIGYLAPELENTDYSEDKLYGKPIDVWALGCVAYQMFLGPHPWREKKNQWREPVNEEGIAIYERAYRSLETSVAGSIESLLAGMEKAPGPERIISVAAAKREGRAYTAYA
ncbi:hypothetical protein H2203_005198 [Taxawa tesnikishii (nom. ined.)]|nr:hypothetical protein H2203_005198 [Dothideales sp. JES 119]